MQLLKRYEKIVKRKIRESKKFKKNNYVKIYALDNNTTDFIINLIRKLNEKFSLNINIEVNKFKFIEDFNYKKNSIIIINSETILALFLMGNKKFIKEKTDEYFNLGYWISEYLLSRELNKEVRYSFRNRDIEKFIYNILAINEKFFFSSIRFIKKYSEFF